MKLQELDGLRALVIRSEIKANDTLEEMIFKSYLKHENLKDTVTEINNLGFKGSDGEVIRIFPRQVSDIIKDKNTKQIIKDSELYDYVKKTFNSNKKMAIRRWG